MSKAKMQLKDGVRIFDSFSDAVNDFNAYSSGCSLYYNHNPGQLAITRTYYSKGAPGWGDKDKTGYEKEMGDDWTIIVSTDEITKPWFKLYEDKLKMEIDTLNAAGYFEMSLPEQLSWTTHRRLNMSPEQRRNDYVLTSNWVKMTK